MNPLYADDHNDALTAFFVRASKLPLLTKAEEKILGERVLHGDKVARNKLVEHNIRLAIKIAKGYRGKGVPFEDLIQETVIGLHRAADKFDPSKGFRYTTYATWWCQHFAQRAVQNKSSNIRIPWQVQMRRAKILRHLDENPEATPIELAAVAECTVEQALEASHVARTTVSLDLSTGEKDDDSPHSLIPDPNASPPDEIPERDNRLDAAMKLLSEDERRVLKLRFGFDGPVQSRKEISERLGIDERAISRLQREAMRKLRAYISAEEDLPPVLAQVLAVGEPICTRKAPPTRG